MKLSTLWQSKEAADLNKGRIHLADLCDDDYDYGGKRGRKKKGKKKGKQSRNAIDDDDELSVVINDSKVPDGDATINDENDKTTLDYEKRKLRMMNHLFQNVMLGKVVPLSKKMFMMYKSLLMST